MFNGRPGPRIPQAVCDVVIDNVVDNADLCACCLVSRAWVKPSRRNLLRCVAVYGDSEDDAPSNSMSIKTFCEKFEDDALSRAFVRALDVGDVLTLSDDTTRYFDVLGRFRGANVSRLTMRYCCEAVNNAFLALCYRVFSTITTLELLWVFDTVTEFAAVVSKFPCLRRLIVRCYIEQDGPCYVEEPKFTNCELYFESPSTTNILSYWAFGFRSQLSGLWVATEDFTYDILYDLYYLDPGILTLVKSLAFALDGDKPQGMSSFVHNIYICVSSDYASQRITTGRSSGGFSTSARSWSRSILPSSAGRTPTRRLHTLCSSSGLKPYSSSRRRCAGSVTAEMCSL